MRRSRTLVVSAASLVVLIAAVAFASAPVHRPFVREDKALEHAFRGDAPMAKGAMKPIAAGDVSALAAPGWAGEIKLGAEDTWEPSIAADPTGPWVYAMYNGFNRPKACKNCPPIPMLLRVSSDNGVTWGAETYPCPCSGVKQFQYDPVMKVANNGVVYATWMNKYEIVFSKSTNHGATWTAPIKVSGNQWGDKPWIGVSPDGVRRLRRVRDEPGRLGRGLAQLGRLVRPRRRAQHRPGELPVPERPRGARERRRRPVGVDVSRAASRAAARSTIETWRTTNGGTSWTANVIGQRVHRGRVRDLLDDGARERHRRHAGRALHGRDERGWTRTGLDAAIDRRRGDVGAGRPASRAGRPTRRFPAIAGGAAGVFRMHYGDNRTGAWNTWYRASTDGGQTWSADVDISDADTGATYKTAAGFASEYGDYGAIDITNTGKTVGVWGEGVDFTAGPAGSGSTDRPSGQRIDHDPCARGGRALRPSHRGAKSVQPEHLDPLVQRIRDVEEAGRVDRETGRLVELEVSRAFRSERALEDAARVEHRDPVPALVGDVDQSAAGRDVHRLANVAGAVLRDQACRSARTCRSAARSAPPPTRCPGRRSSRRCSPSGSRSTRRVCRTAGSRSRRRSGSRP